MFYVSDCGIDWNPDFSGDSDPFDPVRGGERKNRLCGSRLHYGGYGGAAGELGDAGGEAGSML